MAAPAFTIPTTSYYTTGQDAATFWSSIDKPMATELLESLPRGFPSVLESLLVWDGVTMMKREREWTLQLSQDEVVILEDALHYFQGLRLPATSITRDTFPLPESIRHRFSEASQQCYEGFGFCAIRGLDPERYSAEENSLLFMGISSHIAPDRGFQDRKREQVLCHVVNAAVNMERSKVIQPGFTDGAMSFHNDEGEILALYVRDTATSGGRTQICSFWQIYNILASTRPDLIKVLASPWVLDTFQDYSEYPPQTAPFLHVCDGKVVISFSRYPLTGYGEFCKRNPDLPPITAEQLDALNAIQVLASANSFPLPSRSGDILYLNNMAILHGREPFQEHGQNLKRHLLKLQLRDPTRSWMVPEGLQSLWDKVYGPNKPDGTREEQCCLEYYAGQESSWSKNG